MTDADSPDLAVTDIDLLRTEVRCFPAVDRPPIVSVRDVPLLNRPPWVRTIGKLGFELTTQGWRFPSPGEMNTPPADDEGPPAKVPVRRDDLEGEPRTKTRVRPPTDVVMLKDRLLYLLQPPLEDLFAGKQVQLPFPPYPYQIKGVAFLMPRHGALLADEMGLGKTAQVIIALRLLFHAGLIRRALIV
ncbi:MAG TPA: SNF2-related protein, partial [Gemmataceae bacterium]|nr:SNF2-related protein [Gemmataceae bacterium]